MSTLTVQSAVLDEKVWNAWLVKSNLREQATARRARMAVGIVVCLLALGYGVYRLVS